MMRNGGKDITKQVTTSCVVIVKVFSLSLCPDSAEPVGLGEPSKPFNKRCFFVLPSYGVYKHNADYYQCYLKMYCYVNVMAHSCSSPTRPC